MLAITAAELRAFGRIPEDEEDSVLEGFITPAISLVERMTGQPAADLTSESSKLAAKTAALAFYQARDFVSQAVNEAVMKQLNILLAGDLKPEELIIFSETGENSSATEAEKGG